MNSTNFASVESNPQQVGTEETSPNFSSPTMSCCIQIEVIHELIVAHVIATTEKYTATEVDEDTPLYRKKVQQIIGLQFIIAGTRRDKISKRLVNFVQKRDWEELRLAYDDYWYNVRKKLNVKDNCLLVNERFIIPQQLCQTSLHLIAYT